MDSHLINHNYPYLITKTYMKNEVFLMDNMIHMATLHGKDKRKSPLDKAYFKGYEAFKSGENENNCPYVDKRTKHGQVTFSRSYRNEWFKGFNAAKNEN